MSEPIVFITTFEIGQGKVAEFEAAVKNSYQFLEANGPHLMAGMYVDEENRQANGIQVHRDSESILSAWQLADPHIRDVMQYITTTRVEIFGQPSEAVMEGIRRLAGSGASVIVKPRLAGFSRFAG